MTPPGECQLGVLIGPNLAAAPAAYVFFSRTTMNLREQDDGWAAALGGFAMGSVLGLPSTLNL